MGRLFSIVVFPIMPELYLNKLIKDIDGNVKINYVLFELIDSYQKHFKVKKPKINSCIKLL